MRIGTICGLGLPTEHKMAFGADSIYIRVARPESAKGVANNRKISFGTQLPQALARGICAGNELKRLNHLISQPNL